MYHLINPAFHSNPSDVLDHCSHLLCVIDAASMSLEEANIPAAQRGVGMLASAIGSALSDLRDAFDAKTEIADAGRVVWEQTDKVTLRPTLHELTAPTLTAFARLRAIARGKASYVQAGGDLVSYLIALRDVIGIEGSEIDTATRIYAGLALEADELIPGLPLENSPYELELLSSLPTEVQTRALLLLRNGEAATLTDALALSPSAVPAASTPAQTGEQEGGEVPTSSSGPSLTEPVDVQSPSRARKRRTAA